MIRSLAIAPLALGCMLAADPAAPEVGIARLGNTLIVTAPGGMSDSPRLARQMEARLTVDFQDVPVAEALDTVGRLGQVSVVVDPVVRAGDARITLQVTGMTMQNVVTWIATQAGISVQPLHDALYAAAKPVAAESRTVLYDISDVAFVAPDFPGRDLGFTAGGSTSLFNPGGAERPAAPTAQDIEDILRKQLGL